MVLQVSCGVVQGCENAFFIGHSTSTASAPVSYTPSELALLQGFYSTECDEI
jgi:hypothetical protein